MNQQPGTQLPTTARETIAAALDDYWITTPADATFHTSHAAEQIETYLNGYGWTIQPITPRKPTVPTPPPVREIAVTLLLAALTAASAVAAALRHDRWWTIAGALVTLVLAREAIHDIRDRRRGRAAR